MNDDPGARDRQELSGADTPTEPRPKLESASPNPFALLEGGGGSAPAKDVLARLSRILGAARSDVALEGPVRTVTAAWLDADAWQVGIGLDGIAKGRAAVSALAVSDRAGAEPWREAVARTEADAFSTLMDVEESSVPADRLPDALAALAEERGLDRVDLFPIEADGRTAGLIALLRGETSPPPPEVRRAMELSRDILSQIAARVRAREAVAGAARHIRFLTTDEAERPGSPGSLDAGEADRAGGPWRARYELLHRGAEAGLWDWDLEGDAFRASPRWRKLLGYEGEDGTDEPSAWFDRIHPDDADRVELELLEHLEGQSQRLETEHRVLQPDGAARWVRVSGVAERDEGGKAVRLAGSLTDTSAARTRDDRSARDVMYHRLTGFPTAAMLSDRIEQAMRRRTRRPDRSFAVLAVTLEGLQEAAARIGADATDEVLLTVGRRIASAIRPGDTVAHLDDLQFGVVLDDVKNLDDATRVAERIVTALGQSLPLGQEELSLTPASGLALSRTAYENPAEMIRDATIALRRAVRDDLSLQVFDSAIRAFAQSMAELEGDLRRAFDARQLFLEYQPVVSLSDGRITGVEAFLRWEHPERGLIAPSEFIPVAEEAGLMQELGYWVVERSCRQLGKWIDDFKLRFPPTMAINLGEAQLYDEEFVPRMLESIEGSGLDPRLVRLDVSEDTFMKDGPAAGRILRALAQRGIRIAVDDFGTGYSSLSYLHRYPIGALKIDRSFVSGSAGTRNEWDVARTIIELARILELEVIAEGIENREQFQRLRSLGCQQAQGYFFSGPASAAKTGRLIENGYPLDLALAGD